MSPVMSFVITFFRDVETVVVCGCCLIGMQDVVYKMIFLQDFCVCHLLARRSNQSYNLCWLL